MRHRIGFAFMVTVFSIGVILHGPTLPAQHLQAGDDIDGGAADGFESGDTAAWL
jgi:hypothetical protein